MDELDSLDGQIANIVKLLIQLGVETYESCQGGEGHSFPEPTIRFDGEYPDGLRALSIAMQHALPVRELRRVWSVIDGEPVGPHWALTFWPHELQEANRKAAEQLRHYQGGATK